MDQEENKKESVIEALKILKEGMGWKFLVNKLQESVGIAEKKLHGEFDLNDEENIEMIQRERRALVRFMEMPEELIADLGDKPEFPPTFDPYE